MPWTAPPKFDLLPVTAFIDNLETVFNRDYAAALAYFAQGVTIRELQAIRRARQVAEQWPVMNILPAGGDPAMNEAGSLLHESRQILCEWETVSRTAATLVRHLDLYETAGRSVLYEMSDADLRGGIPKGRRAGLIWDVSRQRPGERYYEAETLWTMVNSVMLTIRYTEGRGNG